MPEKLIYVYITCYFCYLFKVIKSLTTERIATFTKWAPGLRNCGTVLIMRAPRRNEELRANRAESFPVSHKTSSSFSSSNQLSVIIRLFSRWWWISIHYRSKLKHPQTHTRTYTHTQATRSEAKSLFICMSDRGEHRWPSNRRGGKFYETSQSKNPSTKRWIIGNL